MASSRGFFLLHLLSVFSLFLSLSTALPREAIFDAADVLTDSGYVSMALTIEIVAETLLEQSPSATVFAPSDSAFKNSGQPSLDLLRYQLAPFPLSMRSLRILPAGSNIPTMLAGQSLTVTTAPSDRIASLNNVRITPTPIYDDGYLVVYGIERFLDQSFQYTGSNQRPNRDSTCASKNSSAGSSDSFDHAIDTLRSGGYSAMASFLVMQLASVTEQSGITVFAPADDKVLNCIGDFGDYPSFFRRHVVPCKLLWNDLVDFGNGSELPTFLEGFFINITRFGGVLVLNGVPDMVFNDKLVVHGVGDVLAALETHRLVDSFSEVDVDDDEQNWFDPPTTQAKAKESFVPNKEIKHKKNPMGCGGIAFMVLATGFTLLMAIHMNRLLRLSSFKSNHSLLVSHTVTAAQVTEVSSTALSESLGIQPFNALHSAAYKPLLRGLPLRISLGVAQALKYLHSTFSSVVAYCNLKAANVLLDEILKPRVFYTGLAILKPLTSNKVKFRASYASFRNRGPPSPDDDQQRFCSTTNNAETSSKTTIMRKAILIGMMYCEDAKLHYSKLECSFLKEILKKKFGFVDEGIRILCDMGDDMIKPTKDEICRQLRWLFQNAGAGDVLFLYIAGHAFPVPSYSDQQALIPAIITSPDHQTITNTFSSNIIKSVPVGATLTTIVNTCMSAAFFKDAAQGSADRGDVVCFSACDENEGIKDGDFYFKVLQPVLEDEEKDGITNMDLYKEFLKITRRGVKLYEENAVAQFYNPKFICPEAMEEAEFLRSKEDRPKRLKSNPYWMKDYYL